MSYTTSHIIGLAMGSCICCCAEKESQETIPKRPVSLSMPVSDEVVQERSRAPKSETVYEYSESTLKGTSVAGAVGGAAVGWTVGGPVGAAAGGALGYVAGHMAGGPVKKVVRNY